MSIDPGFPASRQPTTLKDFTLEALKEEVARRENAKRIPQKLKVRDWQTFETEVEEWLKQCAEDGFMNSSDIQPYWFQRVIEVMYGENFNRWLKSTNIKEV